METMQPALKNGRNVWDGINMPKEEFEARIKQVRAGMAARGLDLLLVYTTGLTEYGDTAYLTNFIIRLPRGTLVAIPQKGEVITFFEGASRGLPSLKLTLANGELQAVADMAKESTKYLKEKKLIPGTVGLAGLRCGLPYQQYRTLMAELDGCAVKDADDLLADFRMIKSVREIDQIRRASRIVSQLIVFLKETAFEKTAERTIEAALYREARFERAEDFRMLIARPGQPGWSFRPADSTTLTEGDNVVLCLAVEFERYWAEAIRTFTFKAGSFVEETSPGGIISGFRQLCTAMKPGVTMSSLCREAVALMGQKGFEVLGPYGLGNGIGLGLQEAPLLTEQSPGELKEGMVLSLRVASADSDKSCSMVGNTVLVTSAGGVVLTMEPARPVE
jgi:Xaa-Pro aminopeptidase